MTNKTLSEFHVYKEIENQKPDENIFILNRLDSR